MSTFWNESATALLERVPGIERAGISDLAIGGRKFSGSAQQRKRRFLLHHGTLLYGFDIPSIGRYLRLPARSRTTAGTATTPTS